ncbi:unnamed protein product [Phyllotreta striolata]|uniref:20 kDa chaperonin, chloroplastic n=1 Tax=Phyllotreta striolata TaxID=444603 RepID=A0A9N9TH43_PHYSR|nr:unnamed protein product [Phyllotreta striolata]
MSAASKSAKKLTEIIPMFNRVLVKLPEMESVTKGGVLLPVEQEPKLPQATVLAVGPGTVSDNGVTIPVGVQPGDEIVLKSVVGGIEIELDNGETYHLYKEDEILAKVVKE